MFFRSGDLSSPIFKGKKGGAGSSSGWLTSFGDLLTLLLCFFICIVSLSRKDPAAIIGPQDVMRWNDKKFDQARVEANGETVGGITIAPLTGEPEKITLHFGREDFAANGEKLSSQAVEWMKSAMFVEGYRTAPQEIVACGHSGAPRESADWYRAMQRVFNLRGQLIDAEITTQGIALQVLGSDCSSLQAKGSGSESAVASLSLEYKREL